MAVSRRSPATGKPKVKAKAWSTGGDPPHRKVTQVRYLKVI
jgi:hypothetical protein